MNDIFINLQSQHVEPPEEETLSLRDFPVTPENMFQDRRSSSQPSEFFEFFTDFANSEKFMSHAEDIIFCGKLVPFKENQQQQQQEKLQIPFHHRKVRRRSESMSELKSTVTSTSPSNNSTPLVMRTSRSLDDKKLNRNSSLSSETTAPPETIHHNSSGKFDVWGVKVPKPPRWLVLMFGAVKFPPEMDLRDIKSRQVRRSGSTTLFPSFDARDMVPVNRSDRKSSWGLLDILGCQGSASVSVTTSFSCLQKI